LLRYVASKNIDLNKMNRLLATFGSVEANSCVSVQPLIEPLSDRELEILHYLATGMSNQAIASLPISPQSTGDRSPLTYFEF
jgi:LuxR family maltose regulon positive regulatory protein